MAHRLLIAVASLIVEHGLERKDSGVVAYRLGCSGTTKWNLLHGRFYLESSQTRNETCVPCIGSQNLIH